jgi:ubiquitin-like 1-activating enzyme E1 B
VSKDYKYN